MDFIYIGDIVNTHGIKGEVRILSDFKYKECVFLKSTNLYIGSNKEKMVINSYRKHEMFDLITFDGINNINDVLIDKGDKVYIKRDEISINGYYNEDLIGMDVYGNDLYVGKVFDIVNNGIYDIFVIKNNDVKNFIPNVSEFILQIDLENHRIDINVIDGLINENWYFNIVSKNVWWFFKWVYN